MPPKATAPAPRAAPAKPASAPDGCAFVRHADGVGCSYRGFALDPDADGRVLIPLEAVDELAAHGFVALSAA